MRVPGYVGWPIVVVSAYGGLSYFANRAIYYPLKYPDGFWDAQHQLGASDVWLETPDGLHLHAWWVAREGAHFATLFFHGNAGNVTHRAAAMREIVAAGSSILMLDYRGYGKSDGRPTEKGLYIDGETAYAYLLGRGYRSEQ